MYYYDPTYILVMIGAVLSLIASAMVKSAFARYSHVTSRAGITGAQAAQMILDRNDIRSVRIVGIQGSLTDCYVPSQKVLKLSESVKDSTSIAAIGVAAHECGHAIQDHVGYAPLVLSHALIPVCNFASKLSWPMILLGIFFGMTPFLNIGIITFAVAISFQIITLPIEFNASNRAIACLRSYGLLTEEELNGVKAVLKAAALTYVAAAASSLLQLLRLILISRSRRRD